MKTLLLAAAAVFLLNTAAFAAPKNAGGCPVWMCGSNGMEINGLSRNGLGKNGMRFNGWRTNGWRTNGIGTNGLQQPAASESTVVNAVILPSGEIVDLR
jgi:hypothetical protein